MGITYESICEKLGFKPDVDKYEYKYNGHEDDSQESPFAKLTLEESLFLRSYMNKNIN